MSIGYKIADKTVNPKPVANEYLRYVKEIIPDKKREEILDELRNGAP